MYNRHVENIMGPIPSHAAPNNRYPHPHRQIDKTMQTWESFLAYFPWPLRTIEKELSRNLLNKEASTKHPNQRRAYGAPKKTSNNSPREKLSEMVTHKRPFRTRMSCMIYSGWEGDPQKQIPNSAVFICFSILSRKEGTTDSHH